MIFRYEIRGENTVTVYSELNNESLSSKEIYYFPDIEKLLLKKNKNKTKNND